MKKAFFILSTLILLASCSEYQKALKSEDIGNKFTIGDSLYNQGKYAKANRLFEQIVPSYRGKPQAEKLMFLNADCYYNMNDYYLANYHFERFVSSYPQSEKVEQAAFLAAKSLYKLSPVYTKDQSETGDAIEKLQVFINTYPKSEYLSEANKMVQELDFKLEKKAYETAKQYNQISDYQASIKSFDNFILDFPGSKLREDALFYRFDSAYNLAVKSVEWKKKQRLETAKSYYTTFKKKYASSKYIEEADSMIAILEEELKKYSTNS